jgi:eukaryotic-like serine/threonine-protein kinase
MQDPTDHPPIAGRYVVDAARALNGTGGGQPAYAARDIRTGRADLMAIAVSRAEPVRANALRDLSEPIENLLGPLAAGIARGPDGEQALFVITSAPQGPSLQAIGKPWPELSLVTTILRPAAQVLLQLESRRLTHRAIRSNNLFIAGPGQPVTLGAAWAAPPGLHQPPAYQPFYHLMCQPLGQGDGTIADDIYALGCLLIALATGTEPLANLDRAAVLKRKLELGSFAALVGEARIPSLIADLARGMLADDPDHRPTPTMLLDPVTARGRRVAARPPRRAPRPLPVGGIAAWDARTLAEAISREPEAGFRALMDGSVTNWLRRGLGDAGLCARIEELFRQRQAEPVQPDGPADAILAMRVVAILEPLAPLSWRGAVFWPDGLGTALAAAMHQDRTQRERLEEAIAVEAIGTWAAMREDRCDLASLRYEARANQAILRVRPPAGGVLRLAYTLNPLLPCGGAMGARHWVINLDTVADAMEAIVRDGREPFDTDCIAFLAAHVSRDLEIEINALAAHHDPEFPAMPWLRILARLQTRYAPRPMMALTKWLVTQAEPLTAGFHNRAKRDALKTKLEALAADGIFAPIVAALDDTAALRSDAAGLAAAVTTLARIDSELARIANGEDDQAVRARRYGLEAAAGLGLTALAASLVAAMVG